MEDAMTTAQPKTSLDDYKRMFTEARDLLAENRREQQIDDDYYHGYQLTAEERRILNVRKQPDTVFNRYRKSINGTLGVLENAATDPRAYGRNPGVDEDSADVVSKTLRFVADLNDFHELRLECAYDYLVPGTSAALVEVDDQNRPKLTQIRWEEFFHDPRSRKKDFSDARYMGIAKWMYADQLSGMYPDKATEIENALEHGGGVTIDDTFEDRPRDSQSNWIDKRRRRLMVVEIYHNEGGWNRCVFHAGGILVQGPSPYADEKKKPDCAIVAQSCYVDRENNRMGVGRDLRSPQDEFNKRRSKLLHETSNRQMQAMPNEMGQLALSVDADEVRKEAARPDGVIPPGWQPIPRSDIWNGQFQLLGLAESELDRQGPNPAILARGTSPSASGRSKQVDQQAGMTEDAVVYKGIHSWEIRLYRAMWNRCKQFWTAPDYIRVTDDEGSPKFIGINQPQMGVGIVPNPETGMAEAQQVVLGYENALAELDVDIVLDVVPDTAALADEQFQTLTELAKFYGPQEVPFDDLLECSSMPNKRQLMEKRKQRADQAGQMGQMGQQLQMASANAALHETAASAALKEAQTAKTQAETEKLGVETNNEAMRPHLEMVQSGFQAGQRDTAAG